MPKMPKTTGAFYVKQNQPKFIREFKERIAYKEQATIEAKKKKPGFEKPDIVTEEKEEDRPQIVQLKSGDLGENEYNQLRDKEAIESSFSSFGKIKFKRRGAQTGELTTSDEASTSGLTKEQKQGKIEAELDSIFNVKDAKESGGDDDDGGEGEKSAKPEEAAQVVVEKKKIYLADEEKQQPSSTEPSTKKARFIDRISQKEAVPSSLSASKVLARETKAGNRKLLSFYDQEEEENEEYQKECFEEDIAKKQKQDDEEDD